MTISLGIDPGMHYTGIAVVDENSILAVGCVAVPARITGTDAVLAMLGEFPRYMNDIFPYQGDIDVVVVEGQQIYRGGSRPSIGEDLLSLALVAGGLVSWSLESHLDPCMIPLPREWKGQVPKEVMNARTMKTFGINENTRLDIPGAQNIKKAEWEHVLDAAGLAHWGLLRNYLKQVKGAKNV